MRITIVILFFLSCHCVFSQGLVPIKWVDSIYTYKGGSEWSPFDSLEKYYPIDGRVQRAVSAFMGGDSPKAIELVESLRYDEAISDSAMLLLLSIKKSLYGNSSDAHGAVLIQSDIDRLKLNENMSNFRELDRYRFKGWIYTQLGGESLSWCDSCYKYLVRLKGSKPFMFVATTFLIDGCEFPVDTSRVLWADSLRQAYRGTPQVAMYKRFQLLHDSESVPFVSNLIDSLSRQEKWSFGLLNAAEELTSYYYDSGNSDSAYKYSQATLLADRNLSRIRRIKEAKEFDAKFNNDRELQQVRQIYLVIIAAGILVVSVGHFSYQRNRNNKIRTSNNRLNTLLESLNVTSVMTINRRGVVLTSNDRGLEMFGYERDELIGQNVTTIMPEPHRSNHDQYLQNYHSTGEKKIIGIGRHLKGRKKSGELFDMYLEVSEMDLPGGVEYVGIIRDITEQIKAKQEIETRAEHAEITAYAIDHDLKHPLTQIKFSLAKIARNKKNTEAAIESIAAASQTADRIVKAMRDYMRETSSAEYESVDFREVLESVIETLDIDVDLVGDFPHIRANPDQMLSVCQNLLKNAEVHGSPPVTVYGDVQRVIFEDQGGRLDPDEWEQLTKPKFKAGGISGHGMRIVNGILKKHGFKFYPDVMKNKQTRVIIEFT